MNESVPEPDGIDAIALSHVRVSLGAKLMEVLKRIGFSDAELVKFDPDVTLGVPNHKGYAE